MLGGIGSILTLLLFVPDYVGSVLVIVGWILILVAVKDISEAVQDKSIYNNALISAILAIIGAVTFAVIVAAAIFAIIGLGTFPTMAGSTPPSGFFGILAAALVGLAVVWVIGIVGSYFLYKSFKGISAKIPVGLFGTGALLYFIGSILTIILVGFFLIFIAQILFAIAFFSIPDRLQPGPTMQPNMGTSGDPVEQLSLRHSQLFLVHIVYVEDNPRLSPFIVWY